MRTLLMMSMLVFWGAGSSADAAPVARTTRCCIKVPADDGGERPYCFNVKAKPARRGRRICHLIGGEPQQTPR